MPPMNLFHILHLAANGGVSFLAQCAPGVDAADALVSFAQREAPNKYPLTRVGEKYLVLGATESGSIKNPNGKVAVYCLDQPPTPAFRATPVGA